MLAGRPPAPVVANYLQYGFLAEIRAQPAVWTMYLGAAMSPDQSTSAGPRTMQIIYINDLAHFSPISTRKSGDEPFEA